MPAFVKHKLLLYADDSAILVHGKHIHEVESLLSSELETVSDWLICNKLSLHLGKTESVLFGSKHKLKSQSKLKLVKVNQLRLKSLLNTWVQPLIRLFHLTPWQIQFLKELTHD